MIPQPVVTPSSPPNPETGLGAVQASTSGAGGSNRPLRFTCRLGDGTIYLVDSQEDDILFQKLEQNAFDYGSLIEVSARTTVF